jgi:putative transposase
MQFERKPNRMKGYDYSQDNLYFVTSCVEDRICCLGNVKNGEMILNKYGEIADQQWYWLADQYPYVVLHEFQVMPNHIHGIIEIDRSRVVVGTGRDLSVQHDLSVQNNDLSVQNNDLSVQQNDLSVQQNDLSVQNNDLPQCKKIKSLSELKGAYKTTVSKKIHLLGFMDFKWQRSFHDHIIRDAQSYDNITNYILNNPKMWEEDEFYI